MHKGYGVVYKNVFKTRIKLNKAIKRRKINKEKPAKKEKPPSPPAKIYKKCPEGKVLNTHTNRCIAIGTALYKEALKKGWLHFERKKNVPFAEPPPKKKSKPNTKDCKNKTTFMMFENVGNIEGSDLIKTPDGYCFSAEELIAYISSEAYDNKNPHDTSKLLFYKSDLDNTKNDGLLENPQLVVAIKDYFKKFEERKQKRRMIYLKTIDVLHEVCNTGRICYYNNITSWEKGDSSTFNRSIKALANLSQILEKLSEKEKEAYSNVIKKIDEADKGQTCIHGVGSSLMLFALNEFAGFSPSVGKVYDNTKTGLIINKAKKSGLTYIISSEHRFTPNPKNSWINKSDNQVLLDMILSKNIIKDDTKSDFYTKNCEYPPTWLVMIR